MREPVAVFDLDGTLVETVGIDDACYLDALHSCFGLRLAVEDCGWDQAPHVTDPGILSHLFEKYRGRPVRPDEIRRFETVFCELIAAAAQRDSTRFAAVPGSRRLLAALRSRGWGIAIATGGFRRSAMVKLATSGLGTAAADATATGSDAASRAEIVATALRRLGASRATVIFGDAHWDMRVAEHLGIPFVARNPAGCIPGANCSALRDFTGVDELMLRLDELRRAASAGCRRS